MRIKTVNQDQFQMITQPTQSLLTPSIKRSPPYKKNKINI